jgi:hypothetical protein
MAWQWQCERGRCWSVTKETDRQVRRCSGHEADTLVPASGVAGLQVRVVALTGLDTLEATEHIWRVASAGNRVGVLGFDGILARLGGVACIALDLAKRR